MIYLGFLVAHSIYFFCCKMKWGDDFFMLQKTVSLFYMAMRPRGCRKMKKLMGFFLISFSRFQKAWMDEVYEFQKGGGELIVRFVNDDKVGRREKLPPFRFSSLRRFYLQIMSLCFSLAR